MRVQLLLDEACGAVEVVVGEDPLLLQQLGVGGVTVHVDEGIARQVHHQLLQRGRHELETVDEAEQPSEKEMYLVMLLAMTLQSHSCSVRV